jgi:hypothetical protein
MLGIIRELLAWRVNLQVEIPKGIRTCGVTRKANTPIHATSVEGLYLGLSNEGDQASSWYLHNHPCKTAAKPVFRLHRQSLSQRNPRSPWPCLEGTISQSADLPNKDHQPQCFKVNLEPLIRPCDNRRQPWARTMRINSVAYNDMREESECFH